jgi:hypothetical protein
MLLLNGCRKISLLHDCSMCQEALLSKLSLIIRTPQVGQQCPMVLIGLYSGGVLINGSPVLCSAVFAAQRRQRVLLTPPSLTLKCSPIQTRRLIP